MLNLNGKHGSSRSILLGARQRGEGGHRSGPVVLSEGHIQPETKETKTVFKLV